MTENKFCNAHVLDWMEAITDKEFEDCVRSWSNDWQ